jgi:hypothetical protein
MIQNNLSVRGVSLLACLVSYGAAFAECKDLVLRMQDSSGKTAGREITMFLNCHEGSYRIPSATTINVFEWKNGQLCHGHRVCGNASYWNGHFGVAGLWAWGDTVTDFTSNTRVINQFKKLADGSPGGRGGDAVAVASNDNKSVCVNSNSQDASPFNLSADVGSINGPVSANSQNQINQNAVCVDKIAVSNVWNRGLVSVGMDQYDGVGAAVGDKLGGGTKQRMEEELQRGGRWMCIQDLDAINANTGPVAMGAQTFATLSDIFRNSAIQVNKPCESNVSTQVNAPVAAIGGHGGNGYSPVFGLKSGSYSTSGHVDTDYNDKAIQVDFALDFGQIERYCSAVREESCF